LYAIVETGGKQYKAEKGETLLVDRLPVKEGEVVSLRAVMFRDSDVVAEPGELEKVKVEATVAEHLRGPKLRVFKYKPKKGYKRRAGHRSELTRLEVTEIKKLTRKPAGAKAEAKPAAKKSTASAGKTGTARKTTTRKRSTTRKTSTRKSTSKKESSDGS
jgi:large subunit ribosomal protein L21